MRSGGGGYDKRGYAKPRRSGALVRGYRNCIGQRRVPKAIREAALAVATPSPTPAPNGMRAHAAMGRVRVGNRNVMMFEAMRQRAYLQSPARRILWGTVRLDPRRLARPGRTRRSVEPEPFSKVKVTAKCIAG